MEELRYTKKLHTLTIDPEFRDLIPPLSEDEYKLLEDSIVVNGCESPLFVWNDTIVDGHNRYEICQRYNATKAYNRSGDKGTVDPRLLTIQD